MTRPLVRVVTGDPAVAAGGGGIPLDAIPDQPFSLRGTTVAAVVDGPTRAGAVLHALVRGADAVLLLDLPDATAFLDAVGRVADIGVAVPPPLDDDQRALLEMLARGRTAGEAARELGMSLRTAHRRLHAARDALGASCNIEAIARLDAVPAER